MEKGIVPVKVFGDSARLPLQFPQGYFPPVGSFAEGARLAGPTAANACAFQLCDQEEVASSDACRFDANGLLD